MRNQHKPAFYVKHPPKRKQETRSSPTLPMTIDDTNTFVSSHKSVADRGADQLFDSINRFVRANKHRVVNGRHRGHDRAIQLIARNNLKIVRRTDNR